MVPAFKELTSWSERLEDSFQSARECRGLGCSKSGQEVWVEPRLQRSLLLGTQAVSSFPTFQGHRTWVTLAIEPNPRCPQRATEEGTGLGLAPAHMTSASGTRLWGMKSIASSIINLDRDTNLLGNQPTEKEKEKGIQDGNGKVLAMCGWRSRNILHPTEGLKGIRKGKREGPKHVQGNTAEEASSARNLRWGKGRAPGSGVRVGSKTKLLMFYF